MLKTTLGLSTVLLLSTVNFQPSTLQSTPASFSIGQPANAQMARYIVDDIWEITIMGASNVGKYWGSFGEASDSWTVVMINVYNRSWDKQRAQNGLANIGSVTLIDSQGRQYWSFQTYYDGSSDAFNPYEGRLVYVGFDTPYNIKPSQIIINGTDGKTASLKL